MSYKHHRPVFLVLLQQEERKKATIFSSKSIHQFRGQEPNRPDGFYQTEICTKLADNRGRNRHPTPAIKRTKRGGFFHSQTGVRAYFSLSLSPRNADRMVDAVVFKGVQQFGKGAAGADDAEARECRVPHDEHAPELEAGPTLHVMLAAEDEDHVDADVVETVLPVLDHPYSCVLVNELLLEVENVRVVGHRQVQVSHGAAGVALALGDEFARSDVSDTGCTDTDLMDGLTAAQLTGRRLD
jgi:hypothetical protein